ncbi:uncharacterized protein LOC142336768 isoform X3 [Convolutriloba macropyga]|uniref:uncharacterized protein LOC142336768 isoform X2 n=1 Tax=Convolutriloba macropyga TaxID=536237 RepID=UPI003F5232F1
MSQITNYSFPTTDDPDNDLSHYSALARTINGVSTLIAIFGFVGNFLTFVTATKMGEKDSSSGNLFMRSLAIADSVSLVRAGVLVSALPFIGFNIVHVNRVVCKVVGFYAWFGTITANFMLVALSMDRVLAVWAPIAYFQRAKRSYALAVALSIPTFAFVISAPTAVIVDIKDDYCIARGYEAYIGLLTLVVMLLLPTVTVMVTTLAIVCKIRSVANSMVTTNSNKDEKNAKEDNAGLPAKQAEKELQRKKRERDMTLSLLFLSVGFLINMGMASVLVVLGTGNYGFDQSVASLLINSVEIPMTLNNSINFYLYFLASQTFRDKLSVILGIDNKERKEKDIARSATGVTQNTTAM